MAYAPDPTPGILSRPTFYSFGMVPNDVSAGANNLRYLQAALSWSSKWRMPVYGTPGTYRLSQSMDSERLNILTGASLLLCANCILEYDFDNQSLGLLYFLGVHDFKWTGGLIRGVVDPVSGDSPLSNIIKVSPSAAGVHSENIVITDLAIERVNGFVAMGIEGDRVRVINPTITKAEGDGGGIRVGGGKGFRCYNGIVESSADAALQFSGAPTGADTADGAYVGTQCVSTTGRPILVGSAYGAIRDVRFLGVTGSTTAGNLAQIQLTVPRKNVPNPFIPNSISGVTFRDVALSRVADESTVGNDGIVIRNFASSDSPDAGTISNVRFENVVVDNSAGAGGSGLWVLSINTDEPPRPYKPKEIRGVYWSGGRIARSGDLRAVIELADLTGGAFAGLAIDVRTNNAVVVFGGARGCQTIAFSDVDVSGLRDGKIGVVFNKATACGWSRGAMSGTTTSIPLNVTADAAGCWFEGTNVAAAGPIVTPFVATPPCDCQIVDNFGCSQRTAASIGAPTERQFVAASITMTSSWAAIGGAMPQDVLRTINGGSEGDVLICSISAVSQPSPLPVAKATMSGNIRMGMDFTLSNPDDTLMLQRRANGDYVQLSRGHNS